MILFSAPPLSYSVFQAVLDSLKYGQKTASCTHTAFSNNGEEKVSLTVFDCNKRSMRMVRRKYDCTEAILTHIVFRFNTAETNSRWCSSLRREEQSYRTVCEIWVRVEYHPNTWRKTETLETKSNSTEHNGNKRHTSFTGRLSHTCTQHCWLKNSKQETIKCKNCVLPHKTGTQKITI